MRIIMLTAALIGILSSGAAAKDFSGFYAGVNAGYARGGDERDRRGPEPITGRSDGSETDTGLPPSARSASETMRLRSRGGNAAR